MISLLILPIVSSAKTNSLTVVNVGLGATSSTSVDDDTYIITDTTVQTGGTASETEKNNSEVELKLNIFGVPVESSEQVNSDADLEIFSENISAKNENVAKIKIKSKDEDKSEVVVVYKHRGKLLGFIPVAVPSKTEVSVDVDKGLSIDSDLAWWGFLVAKKNYDRAEIESQIKNNVTVQENARVDASASAKARVAEAVIAEIQGYASFQASIEENQ